MRNRLYIISISTLFIFFLICCPLTQFLEKANIISIEERGNYKDPEKVYAADVPLSSLLNGIEQGKANLDNTYTNYLPFYNEILDFINSTEYKMHMNFVLMLYSNNDQTDTPSNNYPTQPDTQPSGEITEPNQTSSSDKATDVPTENTQSTTSGTGDTNNSSITDNTKDTESSGSTENTTPQASTASTAATSGTTIPSVTTAPTTASTTNATTKTEQTTTSQTTSSSATTAPSTAATTTKAPTTAPATTAPATTQPPTSDKKYRSIFAGQDNVFKTYTIPELGFLETAVNKNKDKMYSDMLGELAHVNRIAAASTDVNFYVYIGTRMQDTAYYNDIIPNELCTYDMFQEFVNGIKGADGVAYFDIDTVEKRLERSFKTDHHWNAAGVYSGYLQILDMMRQQTPNIGEPLTLKGYTDISGYQYRGSSARRVSIDVYYDTIKMFDVDLPAPDSNAGYKSNLSSYLNGTADKSKYASHYENMFSQAEKIFYSKNNTERRLLIIGDSFTYWLQPLLSTHFDKTYFHSTIRGKTIDYNKVIKDYGITDVLLIQWSGRMLFKASNIDLFLEQVIT